MKIHLQGGPELGSHHIVLPIHHTDGSSGMGQVGGGPIPGRDELSAALSQVTASIPDEDRLDLLQATIVFMIYDGYCHTGEIVCVADKDGEREPGTPVARWWLEAENPEEEQYMKNLFPDWGCPREQPEPERQRPALEVAFDAWWAKEGEGVYRDALTDENGENLSLHVMDMGHRGFVAGFVAALSLSRL